MNQKLLRDLAVLVLIFGGVWVALIYIPWFPDEVNVDFPIDKEEQLGELILTDLLENNPEFAPLNSSVVDSALWVISSRLKDSLGLTEYDYNIVVVNNPEVNAFALPGGNIVVLSGLIEFTETPDELAAVVAHEMAHVEKRHVVDRLVKELGLQVVFGVLTGGDMVILSEISRTVTSTFFDRRQEEEADAFALDLLHRCQISPRALGTLFRRMESKFQAVDHFELLKTHPATSSRIKSSFEYELEEDFTSIPFTLDWEQVKAAAGSNNQ